MKNRADAPPVKKAGRFAKKEVISIDTAAVTPKLKAKKNRNEYYSTIVLFLFPAVFFICVFVAYPIFSSFNLSFVKWNGIDAVKEYIGFGNWQDLLYDGVFFKAVGNNFVIVILSIAIQLPVGMALATLLDSGGRKLNFFKTVYFFPMLMSSVSLGILFKYIYDPQFGIINSFFDAVGLKGLARNWLGEPQTALYSVIAVICWQYIPFYMVLFLASMTSLPYELYEAAIIDGANRNQYFWKIMLPLLKGSIKTAAILSLVGSLKYFDLIYVMTEGGPMNSTELMATYMYKNAFTTFKMGYGSTIATALFIIVVVASSITYSLFRKEARD